MIPSFEETRFVRFLVVCFLPNIIIRINSAQQCFDDGNEFCIDENDILSVDLLPGSFLFADQETSANATKSEYEDKIVDGSIHDAITEMEYHRYVLLRKRKKIIQIIINFYVITFLRQEKDERIFVPRLHGRGNSQVNEDASS